MHLPTLITKAAYRRARSYTVIGITRSFRLKQFAVYTCGVTKKRRIKRKRQRERERENIRVRFRGDSRELKYYKLRHQSGNCNFIKPSSDYARVHGTHVCGVVVMVNCAEVIARKSESKRREAREKEERRRRRRRTRTAATIINGCCGARGHFNKSL